MGTPSTPETLGHPGPALGFCPLVEPGGPAGQLALGSGTLRGGPGRPSPHSPPAGQPLGPVTLQSRPR